MRKGFQRRFARRSQQFHQCHIPFEARSKNDSPNQGSDEFLEFLARAIGNGSTQENISLSGMTREHYTERRRKDHEKREALPNRERAQLRDKIRWKLNGPKQRLGLCRKWTRSIRWQIKRCGSIS